MILKFYRNTSNISRINSKTKRGFSRLKYGVYRAATPNQALFQQFYQTFLTRDFLFCSLILFVVHTGIECIV